MKLYHCQALVLDYGDDPEDIFVWAEDAKQAEKALYKALKDNEFLDSYKVSDFHIYGVIPENGGEPVLPETAPEQIWYSPSVIAEKKLITDLKGESNYRFINRLIKEGKLTAVKEKGGYKVHIDWIKAYNSSKNM